MGEVVKVFGTWGSPFSWRAEVALKLKGVKYEFIQEDMKNKSAELLKYNQVYKKDPVLVHNGKAIAESLIILEYIDETWEGPSILPKDPYDRAMARFWGKFIDDKCMMALWKAYASKGEEHEKAKEEALELVNFLENEVKGKKFFGGDSIGFVDISANFVGYWSMIIADVVGIEIVTKEKHPNLSEWIEGYVNHDIVKENLLDREKMAAYFKGAFGA